MIDFTQNNFASFRNVHVFSTALNIDRVRLLRRQSQLQDQFELLMPKVTQIDSDQLENYADHLPVSKNPQKRNPLDNSSLELPENGHFGEGGQGVLESSEEIRMQMEAL